MYNDIVDLSGVVAGLTIINHPIIILRHLLQWEPWDI